MILKSDFSCGSAVTSFTAGILPHRRRLFRGEIMAAWAAFLLGTGSFAAGADSGYKVILSPANSVGYSIVDTHGVVLEIGLAAWGPNWKTFIAPESHVKGKGDQLDMDTALAFGADAIKVHIAAAPASKNSVTYTYTPSSDKDVDTTCIAVMMPISASSSAAAIHSVTITGDGKDTELAFPGNLLGAVQLVSKLVIHASDGDIQVGIDPPATVTYDRNGVRILVVEGTHKAGTSSTAVTYTFTQPVSYLATDEALAQFSQPVAGSDWFPWAAKDHASPSVFAMDDWLDKPAGKHGGVRMEGDHFQFEDGTPIKFWGTNLAYAQCAPEHTQAEDVATRFARYGVNAVRLHKFTGPVGWEGFGDPNDVTQFDAKGLDKFDYFTSQLKDHGVYYGFSHTFGMQARPGNKGQLLAYDEIVNNLKGNTLGLINYSEDIQDLLIQSVVNLLNHKNPYSGKTYAEDPCLNYIELQNEDDIFWYQTGSTYKKCPTYAKKLRERFADWLTTRYTTQDAIAQAWPGALKSGETLDDKSIDVHMSAYDLTEGPLGAQSTGGRQRELDTASFLHDVQDQFYTKFVKAIRGTGYKGPLCGSPWQAPSMVPEYYNLLSDYEVGYIDRHNYFGEEDVNASMLSTPGSGYLSTGLQQVDGRPFGVSEWITQFPSQYQADGPVIMAAYGLGLQGWDSSYEFNSSVGYQGDAWWAPNAGGLPFRLWYVDSPVQIGQFPALARMISRGDIKEGEVISTRKTSLDEIAHDHFSFSDVATQQGDIKTFGGSCPPEALAAGRCLVQFTDSAQPSVEPDMSKYKSGSVITSTTGQLVWDSADKGFFTINTAGTKAVVGFASGKRQKLGNITITSRTPYASIILTALDQHATLDDSKSALLTVVARAVSTGFTINTINNHMLNPGTAPLLMEPVQADITIDGRAVDAVNVLSQNGALTQKTIPTQGGAFHINSADDQTLYYQVVFK